MLSCRMITMMIPTWIPDAAVDAILITAVETETADATKVDPTAVAAVLAAGGKEIIPKGWL